MERSEHTANLGMEAAVPFLRRDVAFRYTPPVPTRRFSWLSCFILALCGH